MFKEQERKDIMKKKHPEIQKEGNNGSYSDGRNRAGGGSKGKMREKEVSATFPQKNDPISKPLTNRTPFH